MVAPELPAPLGQANVVRPKPTKWPLSSPWPFRCTAVLRRSGGRESRSAAVTLLRSGADLRAANARLASGAATRSDSLRAIIAVGNQQLAVMTADNDLPERERRADSARWGAI